VPTLLIGLGFGHHSTTVASFTVGLIVQIFTRSFAALTTALLYYDLRIRQERGAAEASSDDSALAGDVERETNHELDPGKYSDMDRPKGWYIDPNDPSRMRYWSAGDPPGWEGTTRTPRKIRKTWETEDRGRI